MRVCVRECETVWLERLCGWSDCVSRGGSVARETVWLVGTMWLERLCIWRDCVAGETVWLERQCG